MPANAFQPIIDLILHGVLWLIPVLRAGLGLKALLTARRKGAAGERAVHGWR